MSLRRRPLLVPLGTLLLAGCVTHPGRGRSSGPRVKRAPPPADVEWVVKVSIPEQLERPSRETEAAIAGAVADLASTEFGTYSSAARRLVGMGEVIVPYLGHVGERQSPPRDGELVVTIVLRSVLRLLEPERLAIHLDSPYREVRVAAAGVAGEQEQADLAERLVTLLDDPEVQVRRAAIAALRRLTNRFFGYRPDAPAAVRALAVEQWRTLFESR